jgi:hypothetical protein
MPIDSLTMMVVERRNMLLKWFTIYFIVIEIVLMVVKYCLLL